MRVTSNHNFLDLTEIPLSSDSSNSTTSDSAPQNSLISQPAATTTGTPPPPFSSALLHQLSRSNTFQTFIQSLSNNSSSSRNEGFDELLNSRSLQHATTSRQTSPTRAGSLALHRRSSIRDNRLKRKWRNTYNTTGEFPLCFNVIYCDGGFYSEAYNVENILRNDNLVYWLSTNINIILRFNDQTQDVMDSAFVLTKIVVKAPTHGYTAPCKEGLIFVSHEPISLEATSKYDDFTRSDYDALIESGENGRIEDGWPAAYFHLDSSTYYTSHTFSPTRSGKFVLVKLLRSEGDEDNIDLQYLGLIGYTGPRSFESGSLRSLENEEKEVGPRLHRDLLFLGMLYTGKIVTKKRGEKVERNESCEEEEEEKEEEEEVIDSSAERGGLPTTFQLGSGQVIRGLEEALNSMCVGEKAEVLIAAEYAFGSIGSPPLIPPHTEINYEIEILRCTDEPLKHRLIKLKKLKEEGNQFFKKNEFQRAIELYKKSLRYIEEEATYYSQNSPDVVRQPNIKDQLKTPTKKLINEEYRSLFVVLNSNTAACLLALQDFAKAEEFSREVLKQDPQNIKAIYRLGQALLGKNEFDKAIEQVNLGLQIASNDNTLRLLHDKILQAKKQSQQKEKNIYNRMFSSS
ncbi:hypothetical protein G9A89_014180 [Geosiphon pyriformis]|nr:hypothetical protein G9A89_014180 [Geosiphon pyriformis]